MRRLSQALVALFMLTAGLVATSSTAAAADHETTGWQTFTVTEQWYCGTSKRHKNFSQVSLTNCLILSWGATVVRAVTVVKNLSPVAIELFDGGTAATLTNQGGVTGERCNIGGTAHVAAGGRVGCISDAAKFTLGDDILIGTGGVSVSVFPSGWYHDTAYPVYWD